ncbi:MAG: helix-turn-helix transcriptional regulator [Calditrichia bacterium]
MNTSQKIINLLNRKERTVSELAKELGISRNSVHLQVSKLEATGIVKKFQAEHQSGAGKPARCYRVAGGKEDSFSSAHKPVLNGLIQTIAELPEQQRLKILENAGRSMAKQAGLAPTGNLVADTQKAVEAVNKLDAMAELSQKDKQPYISCHSCPVATLVHTDPLVCKLVAAFFAEATGQPVNVQCQHEETVVCGFLVEKS